MSAILILKLALVPALIALITLAGRRWGAQVAGWLSAFPVVSAPILLFIALEQGADFAAQAAVATASAVLCALAFGLVYAWVALRQGWLPAALCGFGCYFLSVALLAHWAPPLPLALAAVAAALLLAPRLYPHAALAPAAARPASRADIPLRMIAAAALVLLVTHFSARMGPRLSGLYAMFPVMASVLAVFSHRQQGAGFTVLLMRGMVLGYWGFAAFCGTLALSLPRLGIAGAFGVALTAAVAVQGLTRLLVLGRIRFF